MGRDSKYPPRGAYLAYLRSCGYKPTPGGRPFALRWPEAGLRPYLIWVERVSDGAIMLKRLCYQWHYRIDGRRFELCDPSPDEVKTYRLTAIRRAKNYLDGLKEASRAARR